MKIPQCSECKKLFRKKGQVGWLMDISIWGSCYIFWTTHQVFIFVWFSLARKMQAKVSLKWQMQISDPTQRVSYQKGFPAFHYIGTVRGVIRGRETGFRYSVIPVKINPICAYLSILSKILCTFRKLHFSSTCFFFFLG